MAKLKTMPGHTEMRMFSLLLLQQEGHGGTYLQFPSTLVKGFVTFVGWASRRLVLFSASGKTPECDPNPPTVSLEPLPPSLCTWNILHDARLRGHDAPCPSLFPTLNLFLPFSRYRRARCC